MNLISDTVTEEKFTYIRSGQISNASKTCNACMITDSTKRDLADKPESAKPLQLEVLLKEPLHPSN